MDNKISWIDFVKQIWLSPKKREYSEWLNDLYMIIPHLHFMETNKVWDEWLDQSDILYKDEKQYLLDNPELYEKVKEKYNITEIRRVVFEPFCLDIDWKIISMSDIFSN